MMDKIITSAKELREILAPPLSDMAKLAGLRKECGILEDHDFFDNGYAEMMEARKMDIINLIDEDFVQYKKPSMFIGVGTCDFKCDKECGQQVCQNSPLASAPRIQMDIVEIIERFNSNPITEAIVFGGLEPLYWKDGVKNVSDFHFFSGYIPALNEGTDIVVYTGYYPNEIPYSEFQHWDSMVYAIKGNLIFKFGRFIPNRPHRFDDVLGVELASDNQFAINITDIKANTARDLWNKMVAIQKEHLSLLEIETKSAEWYKSYGEQRDV